MFSASRLQSSCSSASLSHRVSSESVIAHALLFYLLLVLHIIIIFSSLSLTALASSHFIASTSILLAFQFKIYTIYVRTFIKLNLIQVFSNARETITTACFG
ncbi:hypothetical protein H2248_009030 [Termitomyces sp. 'cryptogamus']|nr:hypothetical protein H2248_009030 [Termitomyces sp. 'cryptogamus']